MSDNEFIDKLNDIFINYGFIIIDIKNYVYYFEKFGINYDNKHIDFYNRYKLFSIDENDFVLGFMTMERMMRMMFGDENGIFFDYMRIAKLYKYASYSDDFSNFILSIEGRSKEEILLKLQMMGF